MAGRGRRLLRVLPLSLGLLLSGASVWVTSNQAFSVEPSDPGPAGVGGNGLSANERTTAPFEASQLAPGGWGEQCFVVGADPRGTGQVRMYVTEASSTHGLDSVLRLRIDVGVGGSARSCTGFVGVTAFTGTLATAARDHPDFERGTAAWSPLDASSGSRTYRITYRLDPAASNSVEGGVAAATFVWERRSS